MNRNRIRNPVQIRPLYSSTIPPQAIYDMYRPPMIRTKNGTIRPKTIHEMTRRQAEYHSWMMNYKVYEEQNPTVAV